MKKQNKAEIIKAAAELFDLTPDVPKEIAKRIKQLYYDLHRAYVVKGKKQFDVLYHVTNELRDDITPKLSPELKSKLNVITRDLSGLIF